MQIHGLGPVQGPQPTNTTHRPQIAQHTQPNRSAAGVDELDISPEAQLLSETRDIPDIRADRVAEIRASIASGSYETEEKISVALDRLLEEIG